MKPARLRHNLARLGPGTASLSAPRIEHTANKARTNTPLDPIKLISYSGGTPKSERAPSADQERRAPPPPPLPHFLELMLCEQLSKSHLPPVFASTERPRDRPASSFWSAVIKLGNTAVTSPYSRKSREKHRNNKPAELLDSFSEISRMIAEVRTEHITPITIGVVLLITNKSQFSHLCFQSEAFALDTGGSVLADVTDRNS